MKNNFIIWIRIHVTEDQTTTKYLSKLNRSTTTMYTMNVPINNIKFQEMTYGAKGQKMINLSYDETSTAWSQRIIFQVCKNETEALRAPYGLSKPREGLGAQDATKRNLELVIENDDVIKKLKEIDNHVMKYVHANSKSIFRKELSMNEIEAKYKPILKTKEAKDGYEGYRYIIVKTKCPPETPPEIKLIQQDQPSMKNGSIEDITPGSKVVPIIRLLFIWFMSDSFGVTPQADKYLVIPGRKRKFLDDFILENTYEEQ